MADLNANEFCQPCLSHTHLATGTFDYSSQFLQFALFKFAHINSYELGSIEQKVCCR